MYLKDRDEWPLFNVWTKIIGPDSNIFHFFLHQNTKQQFDENVGHEKSDLKNIWIRAINPDPNFEYVSLAQSF